MTPGTLPLQIGVVAVAVLMLGVNGSFDASIQGPATTPLRITRGQYIVEAVAVCWTCHTPQAVGGPPDRGRWLLGASINIEPTVAATNWAMHAPRLAGSPPGSAEQFVTLLTTGIARSGRPPRPPMPQYRMTRADAEAVFAYLTSLQ